MRFGPRLPPYRIGCNVPEGSEFIKADVRNLGAVETACHGVDVVLHLAAFRGVPESMDDPATAETCNGLETLHVLLAAEKAGVDRVIYASSSTVYGETVGVKEEWLRQNPISLYGVKKLTGESCCRVWTRVKGLPTICLRYFNVFGPGQHPESKYSRVFPAFISSLRNREQPEIYGNGEQTRDFTFIDDLVRANLFAIEIDGRASGEVINVCTDSPRTVNEVFRTVSEILGESIEPRYVAPRAGDVLHSQGALSRARSLLGWQPLADWNESVKTTVEWFVSEV